jgi:hypothetical protein
MWEIDTIQIQAILGKQVMPRGGHFEIGRVKEGS